MKPNLIIRAWNWGLLHSLKDFNQRRIIFPLFPTVVVLQRPRLPVGEVVGMERELERRSTLSWKVLLNRFKRILIIGLSCYFRSCV